MRDYLTGSVEIDDNDLRLITKTVHLKNTDVIRLICCPFERPLGKIGFQTRSVFYPIMSGILSVDKHKTTKKSALDRVFHIKVLFPSEIIAPFMVKIR